MLTNVKRALGGSNGASTVSWNAAINYIQNSLKSGMITAEIVVVVDESQVDILCCKKSYDKKQLVTYKKEQMG